MNRNELHVSQSDSYALLFLFILLVKISQTGNCCLRRADKNSVVGLEVSVCRYEVFSQTLPWFPTTNDWLPSRLPWFFTGLFNGYFVLIDFFSILSFINSLVPHLHVVALL